VVFEHLNLADVVSTHMPLPQALPLRDSTAAVVVVEPLVDTQPPTSPRDDTIECFKREVCIELPPVTVRSRTLTLIEREDDNRS
jgi:hypothetical protein